MNDFYEIGAVTWKPYNWIISIKLKYLKPYKFVQMNDYSQIKISIKNKINTMENWKYIYYNWTF